MYSIIQQQYVKVKACTPIQQNALSIDGDKVTDPYADVDLAERAPFVPKVGKRRYARVVWNGHAR